MDEEEENQKDVYHNIARSELHNVGTSPRILPCLEVVSLIVHKEKLRNRWIKNVKGNPIESFQDQDLDLKYKFLKSKVVMKTD